jgi:hypothetical protein
MLSSLPEQDELQEQQRWLHNLLIALKIEFNFMNILDH